MLLQLALKHNDPGSFLKENTKKIIIDPSGSVNWKLIVVPIRSSVASQVLQTRCRTLRRTARVSRCTKDRNFGRYHSSPGVFRAQHPVRDWQSLPGLGACRPASGRLSARRYPWKTADGAAVMYILSERCDDSDPRIPPARFRSLRPAGPERRDAKRPVHMR